MTYLLFDGDAGFARVSATEAVENASGSESARPSSRRSLKKGAHGGNMVSPMLIIELPDEGDVIPR